MIQIQNGVPVEVDDSIRLLETFGLAVEENPVVVNGYDGVEDVVCVVPFVKVGEFVDVPWSGIEVEAGEEDEGVVVGIVDEELGVVVDVVAFDVVDVDVAFVVDVLVDVLVEVVCVVVDVLVEVCVVVVAAVLQVYVA